MTFFFKHHPNNKSTRLLLWRIIWYWKFSIIMFFYLFWFHSIILPVKAYHHLFLFSCIYLFSSIFIKVNFFFSYCIYLLVIDLTSYLLVQSIISIYHTQLRSVCDTMATVLSKFIISIFFNFPNNKMHCFHPWYNKETNH